MSPQGCGYKIGIVNRAHLGQTAGCLAVCCGEKNRPLQRNPPSIPSESRHKATGDCGVSLSFMIDG